MGFASDADGGESDAASKLGLVVRREVPELLVLEVVEHGLGGIQLGRVAWELVDFEPVCVRGDERLREVALVAGASVPDDDKPLLARVAHQVAQERDDLVFFDAAVVDAEEEISSWCDARDAAELGPAELVSNDGRLALL